MPQSQKRVSHGKTARQLVCERIPDLKLSQESTSSVTIHAIDIVAPIKLWRGFEMQVRMATSNVNFNNAIIDHRPAGFLSRHHISNEFYACSDEGDVQGRFTNNVSNVMAAIFQSSGIMCEFSSGRSTRTDCGGIPDNVLTMTNGTRALLVGEFKTPWAHSLIRGIREPEYRPRLFGQIGMYMYCAGVQYGFLSTYNETIFCAQMPNMQTGLYELWISPVITHDTVSQAVSQQDAQNPDAYRDMVSLRECLMYLGLQVQAQHWRSANNNAASTFYKIA